MSPDALFALVVTEEIASEIKSRPIYEGQWHATASGYDVKIPEDKSLPFPRRGDLANVTSQDGRVTPFTILSVEGHEWGHTIVDGVRGHADWDRRAVDHAIGLACSDALVGLLESADWNDPARRRA